MCSARKVKINLVLSLGFLFLLFGPSASIIRIFVFLGELPSARVSLLILDNFDIPDEMIIRIWPILW